MEQKEIFDVSPCIGVCECNQKGYCKGCYRNREERFHWQEYNNEKRKMILNRCLQRKKLATQNNTVLEAHSEKFPQLNLFDEEL